MTLPLQWERVAIRLPENKLLCPEACSLQLNSTYSMC